MDVTGDAELAAALIQWHARHGRHDLPWQHERTPYRVWVSEIMLQQTQVATVVGYYLRFMERFPTVAALAAAPRDAVMHAWSGLGYYARGRNLQLAAQRVVADFGGELPADLAALRSLPGIGRSTAGAILALAFGRRAAILDGNARRVLARYFAVAGRTGERSTEQSLWQLAERQTPQGDVAVYTQAIMDLGATLCTRHQPQCERCPLSAGCQARRCDRVEQFPLPRRTRVRPERHVVLLLAARADGSVLLQCRPSRGVWAGLWAPPQFEVLADASTFCDQQLLQGELDRAPLPTVKHAFTHFDLHLTPWRARCVGVTEPLVATSGSLWYNAREPLAVGLPAPIARLLASLPPTSSEETYESNRSVRASQAAGSRT